MCSEVVDELVGVESGERCEPERDITDDLGQHAAEAQHDRRTELRVAYDADDELTCAAHLLCHEQRDVAVVRARRSEQR